MGIGEPTADGHGVLRVEDVGCGRVVDDDGVFEIAADLGQVLDVVSLVIVAAFTEKPMVNNIVDVKLIEKRIAVLFNPS